MNAENSTDLQNYYLNGLFGIINEIVDLSAGGNYIYRGEPVCYPKISSTLYRSYDDMLDLGEITIEQIQEIEQQKFRDYFRDQEKQDFEIASELQHYGGKSNLIDFTTDYQIALYFACAKPQSEDGYDEDGRIVLLEQTKETIEKYQIRPAQHPSIRATTQKSIFVQPPKGFIFPNDKDVKTVCVPKELKQWILIHLYRFQDISYQTLFNDVYGFLGQESLRTSEEAWQALAMERLLAKEFPVENLTDEERQVRHERTVKGHITRIEYSPLEAAYYAELARYYCFKMREYDCAIETCGKAILLNPNYTDAYVSRGVANVQKRDWGRAFEDLVKAKQLGPSNSYIYGILGIIYDHFGDRPLADEHLHQALELDPSNSGVSRYLQQRDGEDTTMQQSSEQPQLSEKADYLLNQAAANPDSKIERFNLEQGVIVLVNGKDIIQEDLRRRSIRQDRRETVEAEWESALRELESVGYLERVDAPRPLTLFRVTDTGHQVASQSNSPS